MAQVPTTPPGRRPIGGPSSWRPADLAERDWIVQLDDTAREELVRAARAAHREGLAFTDLTRERFPLPALAASLHRWNELLAAGPGFLLLRGFPVDRLDDDEVELAYVGLGTHLGVPVGQNKAGDVLTHIRDERLPEGGPQVRLYRTNKRQDFHTDGADIVGLLCLRRARSGGESRLASSAAVHDEMLRRRPDLLEELYRPLWWDRNGEEQPGEAPWFVLAPFHEVDGSVRVFYIGWYIRDAQRHPDVPRLTPAQLEAMALLEEIANDPAFHVEMDFRPGDVQFLNNGRILHAREAYEDDDDPAERRHLLRLWLRAHDFASVQAGLRSGAGPTT